MDAKIPKTPGRMIDKLVWIHIKEKKVLFVRTRGNTLYYTAGGKRESGETDQQALAREIKEELNVALTPESIKLLNAFEFKQAHNKPPGVGLRLTCYAADFSGELTPQSEIDEMTWLSSSDKSKTTEPGGAVIDWLKSKGLID